MNHDIGETVAWPTYVHEIATAWSGLPASKRARAAILTSNYGEARAADRYGPALGLPPAYSGHMGFWYWGRPPASTTSVLGVGFNAGYLDRFFADVRLISRLENHPEVNNDEQHAPIWFATGLRRSWTMLWPRLKDLGLRCAAVETKLPASDVTRSDGPSQSAHRGHVAIIGRVCLSGIAATRLGIVRGSQRLS